MKKEILFRNVMQMSMRLNRCICRKDHAEKIDFLNHQKTQDVLA